MPCCGWAHISVHFTAAQFLLSLCCVCVCVRYNWMAIADMFSYVQVGTKPYINICTCQPQILRVLSLFLTLAYCFGWHSPTPSHWFISVAATLFSSTPPPPPFVSLFAADIFPMYTFYNHIVCMCVCVSEFVDRKNIFDWDSRNCFSKLVKIREAWSEEKIKTGQSSICIHIVMQLYFSCSNENYSMCKLHAWQRWWVREWIVNERDVIAREKKRNKRTPINGNCRKQHFYTPMYGNCYWRKLKILIFFLLKARIQMKLNE